MARILGFTDILASLIFVAGIYGLDVPRGMIITVGVVMLAKGILFIMNFFSWVDLAAGIILVFGLAASLPVYVLIGLAVFIGLKGLASLLTFS